MEIKTQVAKALLDIEAVFLRPNEPFVWTSGIHSPIYCDNRLVLSYPDVRTLVRNGLVDVVKTAYPEVEMIMGTATAGIPMAALIADQLGLPMGYVRGDAKKHGKQNQIEGRVFAGKKVVVVEDLISTGGSVGVAVEALRAAGAEVLGVVAIFTYGLPKATALANELQVPFTTLTDYPTLIEAAVAHNYIAASDTNKLHVWSQNPTDKNWMNA